MAEIGAGYAGNGHACIRACALMPTYPGRLLRPMVPCQRYRIDLRTAAMTHEPDAQTRNSRHRGLCRRTRPGRGRGRADQAVVQREPRWARARRRWPRSTRRRASSSIYPEGSAQHPARRDRREPTASIPTRIVCGNGSDEMLTMLAERLCAPGRRGAVQRARLPRLSHRHAGQRRRAGRRCRRRTCTSTSMRCWRRVTPKTRLVYLANPEQSDRHLSAA